MKKMLFVMMIVFTSAMVSFAQNSGTRSTIEENNRKMAQEMINNNIEGCLAFYSDNIISLPSYGPMVRGKDQIAANWKKEMESGNKIKDFEFTTMDVREEGNVAIEVGTYNMTMTLKDGNDFTDNGKYLTIWEKSGNDWKVAMEIWNSDINPWETMKGEKQPGME